MLTDLDSRLVSCVGTGERDEGSRGPVTTISNLQVRVVSLSEMR